MEKLSGKTALVTGSTDGVGRLVTRCDVVHVDGPRSVEGAFTPAEALALAEAAGLRGATARRVWPWRWLMRWDRP